VHLDGDKIVRIEGDREHPLSRGYLCPKGEAIMQLVYAPDRLMYPLQREGDGWRRISWDKALDLIADRLKEVKASYGAEAVVIHKGQAVGIGEIKSYIRRFCNLFGTPNFSSSGSQCHVATVMGNVLTLGYLPVPDYENARCIMVWGSNPAASNPLNARTIFESQRRGAKLIVIDPAATAMAERADIYIRIRPGSDGALALGMLNVIISEGFYDKEFVEKWTVGFDKLVELIKGYPPERVEEITWVPAGVIRQAARVYGTTRPACIKLGNALELHTNAVQSIRAISILQAVTGNLDVPGGALMRRGARLLDITLRERRPSNVKPIGASEHPLFCQFRAEAQANLIPEAILTGRPYPVEAMIIVGANPVLTFPNAQKTQKALRELDLLVVMDLFMTETAKLADIVLPAATFLERTELCDYGRFGAVPRLALLSRVIPERGECWPDWRFWFELAKRMGYGEHFPWRDVEEAIDFQLKPLGLTVEGLKKEPMGVAYPRNGYKKYEKRGFRTPSGKVEIYSERLEKFGYDPLPLYHEPDESPVSTPDVAKDYPLILTSGARVLEYVHSRLRNLPHLRRKVPEPWVEIHPQTAMQLGIKDGEKVIVESARGSIEVKARITQGLNPRVIRIPHGWSKANVNILTDDGARDPVSGFPALRSLLCRIRKKGSGLGESRFLPHQGGRLAGKSVS